MLGQDEVWMMVRGYVLFMMLVYMQFFSLLAMQVTADILYQKKTSMHRLSMYQLRYQALRVLLDIDKMAATPCNISKMNPAQLAMQDIRWWRRRGCYLNQDENEYFYVREELDIDDCSVIIESNKQQLAVRYYRNTLLQVSSVNPRGTLMLQDTIAVSHLARNPCTLKLKQVKSGRQMLRWM